MPNNSYPPQGTEPSLAVVDVTTDLKISETLGRKADAAAAAVGTTQSAIAYLKAIAGVSFKQGVLVYQGTVTAVPGANQFTIPTLAGLGAGKFASTTNPWYAFVSIDAAGLGGAPEGQQEPITGYATATGVFTTTAFTDAVAAGDEILILHPDIAACGINLIKIRQAIIAASLSSGQAYYVDPSQAADTGDGEQYTTAKKWTDSAIGLCEDGAGDLIIRIPDTAENIDDDDTDPPIVIDKKGIIIQGIGGGHSEQLGEINASIRRRQNATWAAAAGPTIDAQKPCSLIGLEVVASAQPAIQIPGEGGGENGAFILIDRCRFPGWGLMTQAILFQAGAYNMVRRSRFESLTEGIFLDSTLSNNPDYNDIIENVFAGCTYGINTDAGCTPHNTRVIGNWFLPSNTNAMTYAIRTQGLWDSGEISGNYFGCNRADAYDVTVQALRAAGVKVYGNTYLDGTDESLDGAVTTFDQETAGATDVDGTTWKDLYDGSGITKLTRICGLMVTVAGGWAGNAQIRITDRAGTTKLFPHAAQYVEGTDFTSAIQLNFAVPVDVPAATGYKLQFRSSNAGDGAGKTLQLNNLDIIEVG